MYYSMWWKLLCDAAPRVTGARDLQCVFKAEAPLLHIPATDQRHSQSVGEDGSRNNTPTVYECVPHEKLEEMQPQKTPLNRTMESIPAGK